MGGRVDGVGRRWVLVWVVRQVGGGVGLGKMIVDGFDDL